MIVKATIVDPPAPPHAAQNQLHKWSLADVLLAAALFGFAFMTNIATVLNNAYSFGATLFDSTVFQTIIWRSGWDVHHAPVIGSFSSFNNHVSPINYIPSALSYIVPLDRMSFYAAVYGVVYASLVVCVFALFRRATGGRTILAVIGSLLFYLSGPVNAGQWEPHREIISALFIVAFFLAWGLRRQTAAVVMLALNAAVREDSGILLAAPLLLLGLLEWWGHKGKALDRDTQNTFLLAALSVALSVVSFVVKQLFFTQIDMFSYYYGPDPLSHLSAGLLLDRLHTTLLHGQHLWLPGLVLLAAAIWLRDARLTFGWIAFFPYWLFNFLSNEEINAQLAGYKAFPFILTMVWPAVLALRSPPRKARALILVQALVLISANVAWEDGALRLAPPSRIEALAVRWTLQPETYNAAYYRAFEARLASGELGYARASRGVLALYPYSFPLWTQSWVAAGVEADAGKLDTLLWFTGDRDQQVTEKWLQSGNFPYVYRVVGTKVAFASRKAPGELHAFAGAIELTSPR